MPDQNTPQQRFTVIHTADLEELKRLNDRAERGDGTFGGIPRLIRTIAYTNNPNNKNLDAEMTRALNNLTEKFGNSLVLLRFLRGCLLAFDNDITMPTETEIMVRLGFRKPYQPKHLKLTHGMATPDLSSQIN